MKILKYVPILLIAFNISANAINLPYINQENVKYKDGGPTDLPPGVTYLGSSISSEEKKKRGITYLSQDEIQEILDQKKTANPDFKSQCYASWDKKIYKKAESDPKYFFEVLNVTSIIADVIEEDKNIYVAYILSRSNVCNDSVSCGYVGHIDTFALQGKEFNYGAKIGTDIQRRTFYDDRLNYFVQHELEIHVEAFWTHRYGGCNKKLKDYIPKDQIPFPYKSHA